MSGVSVAGSPVRWDPEGDENSDCEDSSSDDGYGAGGDDYYGRGDDSDGGSDADTDSEASSSRRHRRHMERCGNYLHAVIKYGHPSLVYQYAKVRWEDKT